MTVRFFHDKINATARFSRFDTSYAPVRALGMNDPAARGLDVECGRARNEDQERGCKRKHEDRAAHADLPAMSLKVIGIALR